MQKMLSDNAQNNLKHWCVIHMSFDETKLLHKVNTKYLLRA